MAATILVIEDDFIVLDTIKDILNLAGYNVIQSSNGEESLKKVVVDPPDLILCDINLPGMNGFEVFDALKNNPTSRTIPTIFLSGRNTVNDMRKGMSHGASDYLSKPFSTRDLLDAVSAQIEKHKNITSYFDEEIHKTKYYDEFSGLGNRNLLEIHLKDYEDTDRKSIGIIVININKYEDLKYTLNESELRSLNEELVKRIKSTFEDVNQLYILNNSRFACTIENETQQTVLLSVGDVIRAIKKPMELRSHSLYLDASAGIAFSSPQDNCLTDLIHKAELALDQVLETGNESYKIYKPELEKRFTERLKLQNNLFKALKNNEFNLYYQPKVDLNLGSISGFEVLLRWDNPTYGRISPAKFIPIAESTGLIIEIGEWIVKQVLLQLKNWQKQKLKVCPLAINISVKQFNNLNFFTEAQKQINTWTEKNLIEFELTESIFINKIEQIKPILEQFKETGIKLSLDDFGTGYSSLAYIKNFPFDKIKIDKAFVNDIPMDPAASKLIIGIIAMAKNMGFTVIAEGVETKLQAEFLRKNNCDEIQGFLFSKPLPAQKIEKMFL